jgi:alpha-tubulin suppressor-like RCC1 family protein
MGGGLIQLILNGTQDMCITGNPQITYFKAVHRRHTNFAIESIKQTFNGNPTIPSQQNTNSSNFIISRTGDLIHRMYLEYHNDISGNLNLEQSTSTYRFNSGVNNMSSKMIKDVSIQIGDQQIDKHYGEWLEIFAELTEPNPTGSSLSEKTNNIPENDIKSISCGANHTAILNNNGEVLTFGENSKGQLGINSNSNLHTPMEISGNHDNIIAVSCGSEYTAILKNDGTVLTFGDNSNGRTGQNTGSGNTTTPIEISGNHIDIIAVSCGSEHTAILKNNGTVLTFGKYDDGRLGQGDINSNILTPIEISGNHTDIIAVSCGGAHTALLNNNGKVLTFGVNYEGQLGINSTIDAVTPIEISGNHTDIIAVSCGNAHTAILKNNGTVFTFGDNSKGQLGINSTSDTLTPIEISGNHTDIIAVSCGNIHTAILKNDGTVFTFGDNDDNQLGRAVIDGNNKIPMEISGNHTDIIAVSCGNTHTAILKNNGTVFTFGSHNEGQLGRNNSDYNIPGEISGNSDYNQDIRTLFNTLKFVSDSYPTSGTLFQKMSKMGGAKNSSYLNRDQTFVPLQFWFNRNPGLALPLIALQYHEVKLLLTLTGQDTCFINSGTDISLWVDYIYLDTDERKRFAQTSHEYLIEQLQKNDLTTNKTNTLNFYHPIKELVWYQEGNTITDTNWQLMLNGQRRFMKRPTKYFTRTQIWQHHTGYGGIINPDSIAVYSFAIKPEKHQPSGTCNFSRINNAELVSDLELTKTGTIYAVNYNVLRIMSGMGGLAYSN